MAPHTTQLPPAPVRNSSATDFINTANAFLGALSPFGQEINVISDFVDSSAQQVESDKLQTEEYKDQSRDYADIALAETGAEVYDPNSLYDFPDTVIGIDGHVYRCLGSGIQGDDPVGSNTGNWLPLTVRRSDVPITHTSDFQCEKYYFHLVDTSQGVVTATLPVSPVSGDTIKICDYGGNFSVNKLVVSVGSSKINGVAEDMDVEIDFISFSLIFLNSTYGWVLS